MYNLRTDAYHSQDTIGELQYLMDIATNNKEEIDYSILYVQNRLVNLKHIIKGAREELLDFMEKYQLNYEAFPVMHRILSDDVTPDTASEQNIGAVDVERAMRKNIPNETFDLLKVRTEAHIIVELNDRIDYIKKLKLSLAKYESDLARLYKSKIEYSEAEESMGEAYKLIRTDLENFISLHKSLGEFKYLFTNTPSTFTSDHFGKVQSNRVGQYGVYYVGKKKAIKMQADKIQENFYNINRYATTKTKISETAVQSRLKDISDYFGGQGDSGSGNGLPDQYVDAYENKTKIISDLTAFMQQTTAMIKSTKVALDAIRGTTGIGNRDLEGIFNQAIEIARSPVNARRIDQLDFKAITETNKTFLVKAQKKAEDFKGFLQRGVKSLDQAFIKAQRDLLVRMSFHGFPKSLVKGRTETLEDHVREKVRAKFGFVPFEDEQLVINADGSSSFVKKSELDPATVSNDPFKPGVRKSEAEAKNLIKSALT